VKKVFTAKLDASGAAAAAAGGRTKTSLQEKVPKPASVPQKTVRSSSTTGNETVVCKPVGEPSAQLQLLTVQQSSGGSQHSRSVSPRTPSTVDSSSGRPQSNTGSSSVGLDTAADPTLAGK